MFKKFVFALFITLITNVTAFSQSITLDELIALSQRKKISDVELFAVEKGFEFRGVDQLDFMGEDALKYSWDYDRSFDNPEYAVAFLKVYTWGKPHPTFSISLRTSENSTYIKMRKRCMELGYTLQEEKETEKGSLLFTYKKGNISIDFLSKSDNGSSYFEVSVEHINQ